MVASANSVAPIRAPLAFGSHTEELAESAAKFTGMILAEDSELTSKTSRPLNKL